MIWGAAVHIGLSPIKGVNINVILTNQQNKHVPFWVNLTRSKKSWKGYEINN